ncbi:alpha/beta hydrolase [Phenylobacterium sp.]|uniref:alpha/beta hydrolase n=1 Tax=Phenylobacterium sp. TaxID=1871053 RepID=UPI002E33ECD9|nr:alpha/beta fold hydrolase [Phenylobacterium sp.]HEX2560731.1 alpha/beta fold hydrolase [Phenylobacterium sp.]
MRAWLLIAALLTAPLAVQAKGLEKSVAATGAGGTLHGAMLTPSDVARPPVVLIVPGSGPTDKDGNNPLGATAASYRRLAEAMVDQGVASVRIDKRGMFDSAGAAADPNKVTIADYARDVQAWAQALKPVTGARCIWLLGHSEGALVAAAAAAERSDDVCGLVLVAAPGRPLGQVLRDQLKANPANAALMADALAVIEKLERRQPVDVSRLDPALQRLFSPVVQPFLMDLIAYDPPELLKKYKGPVLVVQGTTDLQITMADAERLAAARPGVKLVKVKGMNHVLKEAPADRAGNLATYRDPLKPVAHGAVDAIVDFVKGGG